MSDVTATDAPTTDAPADNARPSGPPGGTTDDTGNLRTDDFGLDGDMTTMLADALTARFGDPAERDNASDAPDSSADTAATPAPAPDPGEQTQAAVVDGAGGGSAADESAASLDAAAPAPAATDFDLNAYARDYFGTNLTREQSAELFGVLSGLQALSPDERARLDQMLANGELRYPTTGQPAQQPQPQYAPQQMVPQQAPTPDQDPAVAVLGPRPDDEYTAQVWDMNARAYRAQQQQIDALNNNIAEQTYRDQQREMQLAQAQITAAESSWRESHPLLTDGEWDSLQSRAVASGQFPALVAAHRGDRAAAVAALYDQHFWADESLRTKALANAASGRQPMDANTPDPTSPVAQQQAQVEAGRQQLAASVAGGGGNISAPPGTVSAPSKDPTARRAQMTAEIAASHEFDS